MSSTPIRVAICQSEPDAPKPPRPARAERCDHCGLMSLRNQWACYHMNGGRCTTPPRATGGA